jgi:hypothetical protein
MAREFEIIGAGALGALLQRKAKHAPEPGTACHNCDAVLAGPYCHVCGQDSDDHHRSIAHLTWEGVEGLTHLDGRLAQTIPLLLFQPGRLARDHLEGRRARHVPPFRLFLISLLVFMTVLEALLNTKSTEGAAGSATSTYEALPPGAKVDLNIYGDPEKALRDAAVANQQAEQDAAQPASQNRDDRGALESWFRYRIKRAEDNQEYYKLVLFTWAHRLAVLLLPILAALLAGLYARRKKFFVYDHLIVAMQFLSFEFLIFAVAWLIPDPVRVWALLTATVWSPVNLYMILRGAYGSGAITAGIKTLFLWFSALFLFVALMVGLLTLALAEM